MTTPRLLLQAVPRHFEKVLPESYHIYRDSIIVAITIVMIFIVAGFTWYARRRVRTLNKVPPYWHHYGCKGLTENREDPEFFDDAFPVPVEQRQELQDLMNRTCSDGVKGFRLVRALRVENSALWVRYRRHLQKIRRKVVANSDGPPQVHSNICKVAEAIDSEQLSMLTPDSLHIEAGEAFFWLGTRPDVALAVIHSGELGDLMPRTKTVVPDPGGGGISAGVSSGRAAAVPATSAHLAPPAAPAAAAAAAAAGAAAAAAPLAAAAGPAAGDASAVPSAEARTSSGNFPAEGHAGWYFSDDFGRADSFAAPGMNLYHDCYCMLLCRVVLGRQKRITDSESSATSEDEGSECSDSAFSTTRQQQHNLHHNHRHLYHHGGSGSGSRVDDGGATVLGHPSRRRAGSAAAASAAGSSDVLEPPTGTVSSHTSGSFREGVGHHVGSGRFPPSLSGGWSTSSPPPPPLPPPAWSPSPPWSSRSTSRFGFSRSFMMLLRRAKRTQDDFDSLAVESSEEDTTNDFFVSSSSQVYPEFAIIYDRCSADSVEIGHDKANYWDQALAMLQPSKFPGYWANSSSSADADFFDMFPAMKFKSSIQNLADNTWKHKRTRDRKRIDGTPIPRGDPHGDMPIGMRVLKAWRVEHAEMWRHYHDFCQEVSKRRSSCTDIEVRSVKELPWNARRRLQSHLNEVYLWHGTSPAAVQSIACGGFDLALCGSNVGSMFGNGVYLAECSSKADEYARDDGGGIFGGCFAMLLCRVVLGEAQILQEADYTAHERVGPDRGYDSTVGDRESIVGTYKEFVVGSRYQVYPEYALLYERIYRTGPRMRGVILSAASDTDDEDEEEEEEEEGEESDDDATREDEDERDESDSEGPGTAHIGGLSVRLGEAREARVALLA